MSVDFNKKSTFPTYLIPIVIGMLGILFAQQVDNTNARIVIVLVSVAAPLFAAGSIFSRLRTQGAERFLTLAGIALLCVGAVSTASGFVDDLNDLEEVPQQVVEVSRWLGFLSLFVGLMALLFMIVRREQAISTISDRFHNLAENMGDGLILSEPNGPIHVINDKLLEMVGRNREEVIGISMQELADSLGIGGVVSQQLAQRSAGLRSEYEASWTVNGHVRHFWISGAPVMDEKGALLAMLATVRDITDKKRMSDSLELFAQQLQELVEERTEQLQESEARLRELLFSMNEGFVAFDEHFEIDFANPRFMRMIGESEGDAKGGRLFEFFDPKDRQHFFDAIARMRSGDSYAETREARLLSKDGSTLSVMIGLSAGPETVEKPAHFSAVVTDVSTLKNMQHELTTRAEDLEAANSELLALGRAKDTFLSNVTHELRTPLSTLHGYAEMLLSNSLGELTSSQENAVGIMDRNLQRLGTLINEMIDFSRMEIRGVELKWTIFSLERLAAECISALRYHWETKDVRIIMDVEEDGQPIWGDHHRIGQVITNLLSNAIKFSPRGSVVTLKSRARADGSVALEVIDQGIGIPAHLQGRVFEKFFQVDSSHNRKYEGAGIGLSIARSIARAHGGDIDLVSTPDEGSRFTVRMPRARYYGVGTQHDDALNGLSILVIEEQQDVANALVDTLKRYGARVHRETSGHAAIRAALENQPDIVVAGSQTGEIAQAEFIKRLRESEMGSDPIPLLRICDVADSAHESIVATDDAETRLPKPFTQDELLDAALLAARGWTRDEKMGNAITRQRSVPGVLVLDGDPDLRDWVEASLIRRGVRCICAADLSEARRALAEYRGVPPTLVFADVDTRSGGYMPEVLADELTQISSEIPWVVYGLTSAGLNGNQRNKALDGVIQKPFTIDDLMKRIIPKPAADQTQLTPVTK